MRAFLAERLLPMFRFELDTMLMPPSCGPDAPVDPRGMICDASKKRRVSWESPDAGPFRPAVSWACPAVLIIPLFPTGPDPTYSKDF